MIIYAKKYDFETILQSEKPTFSPIDSLEISRYFTLGAGAIHLILQNSQGNKYLLSHRDLDATWHLFIDSSQQFFWNFTGYTNKWPILHILKSFDVNCVEFEKEIDGFRSKMIPQNR